MGERRGRPIAQNTDDALHAKGWKFYQFIAGGGCRFMCAWDTNQASVDALLIDMHSLND
jgi:threonine aldolase